jgi:hypothetical protein
MKAVAKPKTSQSEEAILPVEVRLMLAEERLRSRTAISSADIEGIGEIYRGLDAFHYLLQLSNLQDSGELSCLIAPHVRRLREIAERVSSQGVAE